MTTLSPRSQRRIVEFFQMGESVQTLATVWDVKVEAIEFVRKSVV